MYCEPLVLATNKAYAICSQLKIPIGDVREIKVNSRARKRWGQCWMSPTGQFEIEVNEQLCDGKHEDALICVLLHELIHTVGDCQNHGKKWQAYADKVNRETKYHIRRCASPSDYGFEKMEVPNPKYSVKCLKCGGVVEKSRICDFVRNPQDYRHLKCGGREWIVTKNY